MPFFAKVLLFFSVPALLFAVLAVPSLKTKSESPAGDSWQPLSTAGVSYLRPQGWTVIDPLTTGTSSFDERWSMAWPARESVHAAAYVAENDSAQVTIFVGPRAELEPMVLESNDYYRDNVMIERAPSTRWRTADGLELRVERARYLPGPLTGDDSTLMLAWGTRGETTLIVNAGGPTKHFPIKLIEDLLGQLTLSR